MSKLSAIWNSIKADLKDTWNRSKVVILTVVGLIIAFEFQKLKEWLLVYMGQRQMKSTQKQDVVLSNNETQENQQANTLIQHANKLPSTEQPVQDDWYKKDSQ